MAAGEPRTEPRRQLQRLTLHCQASECGYTTSLQEQHCSSHLIHTTPAGTSAQSKSESCFYCSNHKTLHTSRWKPIHTIRI